MSVATFSVSRARFLNRRTADTKSTLFSEPSPWESALWQAMQEKQGENFDANTAKVTLNFAMTYRLCPLNEKDLNDNRNIFSEVWIGYADRAAEILNAEIGEPAPATFTDVELIEIQAKSYDAWGNHLGSLIAVHLRMLALEIGATGTTDPKQLAERLAVLRTGDDNGLYERLRP